MAKQKAKASTKSKRPAKPKARVAKKSTRSRSSATATAKKRTTRKAASTATRKKAKKRTATTRSRTAQSKRTKTTAPAKAKTRTKAAGGNNSQQTARPAKRRRSSRLSKDDLAAFRELLLSKRAELAGDVSNLRREAMRQDAQTSDRNLSNMPTHMADLGSDNWEQEFTLGLLDKDMALLKEIDDALERINDGSYGLCLGLEKPIGKTRLRAKPWAKYCIEYAEMREKGLVD